MADLTGKRLGKYELVERLGRGGMAEVYKSYQPGMDRFVAIKVMHSHLAESEDFVTRFKREAQLVGQLRHPHIVQVIDFDVQDEGYYMVMEYIKGETLKYYIQQKGPLEPDESLRITSQLADALHYAHKEGMIHRDIKPANVMFTDKSYVHPVLTDFGIARIISGGTQLTASGAFVGTPAYISPEIAKGEQADERSDIYSMGIMLYEMLTGKVPYDADTPFAVIMKHVNEPLPSPRQLNLNVTDSVERVVFTALAKSPNERYQTAAEFRDALNEALGAVGHERPTVSGEGRGTDIQNQATATIARDQIDNLATVITDSQQVAQASPATMVGDGKRNNLLRNLIGLVAIVAILALGYTFFLQPDDDETTTQNTQNTPEATITAEFTTTPEVAVADVGDYDNSLVEQGQYGRAISNYTTAILQDPENPLHYVRRAEAYGALYLENREIDNRTKAEEDLEQALELDPNFNPAYLVRGKFYSELGEFEVALSDFNRAIELDPTQADLFAERGFVHLARGNQEAATTDFAQATTLDASNSLAYLGQAELSLDNGDFESALFNVSLALETNPEFAEAYALRGAIHMRLGNTEDAKSDFDTALNLNNRLVDAYIGRGMYYEDQANTRLAVRDYSTALSQRPDPELYLLRANLYMEEDEIELAEADYEAALELDDKLVEAYLGIAEIQETEGDNDEAIEAYSSALELDDTLESARVARGWLYFDNAEYDAAAADFMAVYEVNEDNLDAVLGLGDIAVENEEYTEAIEYYEEVLEENTQFASAYFGRGLAYAQLEDYETALNDFNAAIQYDYTELDEAYFERGLVHQALDNSEEAVLDFTEAIDVNGDFANAYFYRGVARYEIDNFEAALEDFDRASELGLEAEENQELLEYRGITYSLAGNHAAALEDFNAVLAEAPDNEEVLYYRATTFIATEDYESAIDDLTTLIENDYAELGLAYLNRGIAFRETGEDDRAISDFDRAIDQGDNSAVAYFQRGLTYFNQREYERAETDFSAALNEDDTLPDPYYYRAEIYIDKNEYELALDDFSRAVEYAYDPLEHAYVGQGVAYYFLGDDDEAIRNYTEAIKINPEYGLAYYNRGLAYEAQDDYQRAVDNFSLAIENDYISPDKAYYERGLAYDSLGEYENARDDYTAVIDLDQNNVLDAYYERGRMNLFVGDYDAAIADNTFLLNADYEFPEYAFNNRGVSYLERGDADLAIEDFTAAIQIDGNYALAYANRAKARRVMGDYEAAIADYQDAERLGYSNASNLAFGLGISYFNLEEYQQALVQFNTAVDLAPEEVDVLLWRARTRVQLRQVGAALGDYDTILALDVENIDAYYERGLVFMSEENWDDAIDDFENVLLLNSDFADAYYQIGAAYRELGDVDEALTNLERATFLNPDFADAYYIMGDIHFESGDLQLAFTNYSQYAQLEGDEADPRAVQRLAQLESALGDTAGATPVPADDNTTDETPTVNADRVPYGPAVVLASDDSTVGVQVSLIRGISVNAGLEQALNELNKIIEDDGETVPYIALRAELNLRLGQTQAAVEDANYAIELDPEHPAGYLVLAVYHTIYEYDADRALELAQLALAFAPDNGYVALVYADIQREFGRFDQALDLYNTAEELDIPVVNVLAQRASLYFQIGEYENAIADGERLLELNEYDAELSLGVAGAYILSEDYPMAQEVIESRVVRWGAENIDYYTNAAYVAYRNGDYEQAREWVSNTLASYESPTANYILALVNRAEGNYEEALAQFEALRDFADWEYSGFYINPRYGHNLAVDTAEVYRLQDDLGAALAVLDTAIANDPFNGMYYLGKAEALAALGNDYGMRWNYLYVFTSTYDFNVTQLAKQRVLAQGPELTFDLAYQLLDRFDSTSAWELIQPALAAFPDNTEFRWLQARYLIQQNNIQEASILGEALVLEDDLSPYGYLIQADLAWYADDQTQFAVLTEQAFSRAPEQPYVALEHARSLRYTNQVSVAVNVYATAEFNGLNPGILLYERGLYNYELNRFVGARDDLSNLAALAGEYTPAEAVLALLASYLQLDQPREAVEAVSNFADIQVPDWAQPNYYGNLAYVAYTGGDTDLANRLVERALNFQDDNTVARYVQALVLAAQEDYAGASEIFAELDENTSIYDYDDPFLNIEFGHLIWFDWGNVETAQGNLLLAIELYTRAVDETNAEWFPALVGRGNAAMLQGDFELARTDLEAALILADDLPESKAMIEDLLEELAEQESLVED